jgi:hypothetical protein
MERLTGLLADETVVEIAPPFDEQIGTFDDLAHQAAPRSEITEG